MREFFEKLQRKLQKKLPKILKIVPLIFIGFSVRAEPCADCNKLHVDQAAEEKIIASYTVLKQKNEDYLKQPNVPAGAAIKVNSNLFLIQIKLETSKNKIEAINVEKTKLNGCTNCPLPKPEKT